MPTLDGGHLFLTGLYPVRTGLRAREGEPLRPWSHHLREELALLPTARQNPETDAAGFMSPFARCRRTHFARLVVIDQPMWGGRMPVDPILNIVLRRPLKSQPPYDVLSRPWLLLAADIDRTDAPDGGLASWAEHLWAVAGEEMRAIFSACEGFEAVIDGHSFARYLARGQIETTMSFNGYYDGEPPLGGPGLARLAARPAAAAAAVVAAGLLAGVAGLLAWLAIGLAAALLVLWLGLGELSRAGARPFPPFPESDLPSVLKALFVQQRFAAFVEAHQLDPPEALHAAFAAFLGETRPADTDPAASQQPGVIRSDGGTLAAPLLSPPGEGG